MHYSRLLPVHIRYMTTLAAKHPDAPYNSCLENVRCTQPRIEVEEQTSNQHDGAYDTGHQHRKDQQSAVQAASVKEDKALVKMLEEMGNQFPEHNQCLLIIATIMLKL